MQKYAVVMSVNTRYLYYMNALLNGIIMHDNDVDVHVLCLEELHSSYLASLPSNVCIHKRQEVPFPNEGDPTKNPYSLLWWVQYARYVLAARILHDYDAIFFTDSDAFCVGNFMKELDLCYSSGELVMIKNILGKRLDNYNIDDFIASTAPPYHCHGAFYNKKHISLLEKVWSYGVAEDICDMGQLWRTILRGGYDVHKIIPLKNELWCMTDFWKPTLFKKLDDRGRLKLYLKDTWEEVIIVHGQFRPNNGYRQISNMYAPIPGCGKTNNFVIFCEVYDWLNDNGQVVMSPELLKHYGRTV